MYREFKIISITSNTINKTVTFEATLDIDPLSVEKTNVIIYDANFPSQALEWEKVEVFGCVAVITLKEWPDINKKYRIKIKDVKNVINQALKTEHIQTIYFKSAISQLVTFKAPLVNSNTEDLHFIIEEQKGVTADSLLNSYYLELSSDPTFNRILYKDYFESNDFVLDDFGYSGQIFARCRVQKEEAYGSWETISFNYKSNVTIIGELHPEESYEPIFEDDLEILIQPEQAVTPKSFMFAFDCDTLQDIDQIKVTVVKRRY